MLFNGHFKSQNVIASHVRSTGIGCPLVQTYAGFLLPERSKQRVITFVGVLVNTLKYRLLQTANDSYLTLKAALDFVRGYTIEIHMFVLSRMHSQV